MSPVRLSVAAAVALATVMAPGGRPSLHAQGSGKITPPVSAQRPALTFRSIANYVEVDAVVTDAGGEPVRDLTARDFEVSEDGRVQPLTVCAFVEVPVDPPLPVPAAKGADSPARTRIPRIEPDVATNAKPFDGRVMVVVLDALHVVPPRDAFVKREAQKFIDEYLGTNDVAAVVHIGAGANGQEFTSNRALLSSSVTRFVGQGLPSTAVSTNKDALQKDNITSAFLRNPGPAGDPDSGIREYMARESLITLRDIALQLEALKGRRKAIMLFSEGLGLDVMRVDDAFNANRDDHPPYGSHDNSNAAFMPQKTEYQSVRLAEQQMIAAASKSNVSIYAIDPRGLTTGQEDAVLIGVTPANGRYANSFIHDDIAAESRRQQASLRMYAEETGGLAIIDRNDMDDAFRRIVRDNSAYYVLGYASRDPNHDARFHRVSVKVTRPGLQVRTHHGYSEPDDKRAAAKKPADPVVDLLGSPIAVGGLGMRASASVIKTIAKQSTVHLTVEFAGGDVALKKSAGLFTNDIDVEYLALDMKGDRKAGSREVAHLQLQPATQATFSERGLRYVTEFGLPPGRYQLRVAAREHLGGNAGSVFCDIEVPDVTAAPLVMSDLLLTTSSASKTATPNSTSSIGNLLPTPTTTAREFGAGETVTVAASFYDNETDAGHEVTFVATVRTPGGAEPIRRSEHKLSTGLTPAKGGFSWVVPLPLASLTPGPYVLTVEARSALSGTVVSKAIEFRVK